MVIFESFLDIWNWIVYSLESIESTIRRQSLSPDVIIYYSVVLGKLRKVRVSKVSYQWNKESNVSLMS